MRVIFEYYMKIVIFKNYHVPLKCHASAALLKKKGFRALRRNIIIRFAAHFSCGWVTCFYYNILFSYFQHTLSFYEY